MIQPPRELTIAGSGANTRLYAWLNALLRYARQNCLEAAPGYRLKATTLGTFLTLDAQTGASTLRLQWMIVKEIQDDFFNCHEYDFDEGEIESTDFIPVAKPYELQVTPWDGKTITVFKNNGTTDLNFSYADEDYKWARRKVTEVLSSLDEIQIIVPPLRLGEIILAVKGVGTGVSDEDGNDVEWQAFSSGHEWAEAPESDPVDETL